MPKGWGKGFTLDKFDIYTLLKDWLRFVFWVWASLDQWTTTTTGSASVISAILSLQLTTGGTNGSTALVRASTNFFQTNVDYVLWRQVFNVISSSLSSDSIKWFIMGDNNATIGDTVDHIGWKIVGRRAWASCAKGGVQTKTDTGVDLDYNTDMFFEIRYDPNTLKAEYYINDVLVATHTTNLNNAPKQIIKYYITNSVASNKKGTWRQFLLLCAPTKFW